MEIELLTCIVAEIILDPPAPPRTASTFDEFLANTINGELDDAGRFLGTRA